MPVVRWVFTDPVTSDTATFDINPRDGGSPSYAKNIVYKPTSAPEGRIVVFEGRSDAQTTSFSGIINTEDQYNFFIEWFNKRNQFFVTDDLGREFTIYITQLELNRKRQVQWPWKHEYTVSYLIVDWE